ncbi:MAG: Rab family GTPase [Promethearchaeota archaeon]
MSQERVDAYVFKLVLLGDFAVGKTSLIQRFVHNKFNTDYKLTIGVNVMTKMVNVDDLQCTLSIFDLAGQEKFRDIQDVFYVGTNAAIYVFDFTRPETLDNLIKWQGALFRGVRDDWGLVQVLVGNKIDLEDQMLINPKEAEVKAFELGCTRFIQTSALTGEYVEEVFWYISEKLVHQAILLSAEFSDG